MLHSKIQCFMSNIQWFMSNTTNLIYNCDFRRQNKGNAFWCGDTFIASCGQVFLCLAHIASEVYIVLLPHPHLHPPLGHHVFAGNIN